MHSSPASFASGRRGWWQWATGETNKTMNYKHGMTRKHQLYHVWAGMRRRCYSPKDAAYRNYGARGITICAQWKENFAVFFAWALGHGWSPGLELDRRNNNGNYRPGNCHFTTPAGQARNRRSTKLTVEDVREIKTAMQQYRRGDGVRLAKQYGVKPNIICGIRKGRIWKGTE